MLKKTTKTVNFLRLCVRGRPHKFTRWVYTHLILFIFLIFLNLLTVTDLIFLINSYIINIQGILNYNLELMVSQSLPVYIVLLDASAFFE